MHLRILSHNSRDLVSSHNHQSSGKCGKEICVKRILFLTNMKKDALVNNNEIIHMRKVRIMREKIKIMIILIKMTKIVILLFFCKNVAYMINKI